MEDMDIHLLILHLHLSPLHQLHFTVVEFISVAFIVVASIVLALKSFSTTTSFAVTFLHIFQNCYPQEYLKDSLYNNKIYFINI